MGVVGEGLLIGVDVGGTKMLAGIVGENGAPVRLTHAPTPPPRAGEQALEHAVVDLVERVAVGASISAVGLAVAGFVDSAGAHVRYAPHLAWRDAPVRQRFERRLAVPVALDNDATAATHAEVTFGAAVGVGSALVVNLGTGIGGGYARLGEVVRGSNGMAGEFGHMQLVPDGHPCPCGLSGCFEQYASGRALERLAREAMVGRMTLLEELCGSDASRLRGPMVTHAAEQGDLVALEAFNQAGSWLGQGLANLVAAFDPELVVIGGGVAQAGERLLEPARRVLQRRVVGADHRRVPHLVGSALDTSAGLVGAADLARRLIR